MQAEGGTMLGLTAEVIQEAIEKAGDEELAEEVTESGGAAAFLADVWKMVDRGCSVIVMVLAYAWAFSESR